MKNEPTKLLLAESLKALLSGGAAFEKITIRDITDGAGLIRPTFYNHFQDKYELLEWIFLHDIIDSSYALLEADMIHEALRLMLAGLQRDRDFYIAAARVEGQNSFHNMMCAGIKTWLLQVMEAHGVPKPKQPGYWLTPQSISEYYAHSFGYIIYRWIREEFPVPAEDVLQMITYVAGHTIEQAIGDLFSLQ